MADTFATPRSGNYIDVPRARPHMGAGAALVAKRTGKRPPKTARERMPERMHDLLPPPAPVAEGQVPVEEERMFKMLVTREFGKMTTKDILAALQRKMDEHVAPARTMIRALGKQSEGLQNKVDVRSFCIICINMGVVISPDQAVKVLEAKGLPTDGSLTIAGVIRAFRTKFEEEGVLHERVAAANAYREARAELVHPWPSYMTTQELAHALVAKLQFASSSDHKVLMDMANRLRRSALTVDGRQQASDEITWRFLVMVYKRHGIKCTEAQAKEIWKLYGLPDVVTIADFCDFFISSNRNWVMYPRHPQPPAEAREPHFASHGAATDRSHFRANALNGAFDDLSLGGTAPPKPPPRPRAPKATTPRRAEADRRRAEKAAHARQRVLEMQRLGYTAPVPAPPSAPRPDGAPVVPKLRLLATQQPLPADALKSPRRLVSKKSPVEMNSRMPEKARLELLQAYNHAMYPAVSTRSEPPMERALPSSRQPYPP
mmetsp:Transcript_22678/g.61415  ORF Transcript_22678/g.61415 Transcript_22678/m.61415 type:complete len:489 (-) Transcript_22678:192-1658(-)